MFSHNLCVSPNISASQLMPKSVDFHKSSNLSSHHTEEYSIMEENAEPITTDRLIVRRGQEFKLTVNFDRPFHHKKDKLILQLAFGKLVDNNFANKIAVNKNTFAKWMCK